jgi:HD-GYP domain-containing protein (c-di-GMP phosphodiesterase class II)
MFFCLFIVSIIVLNHYTHITVQKEVEKALMTTYDETFKQIDTHLTVFFDAIANDLNALTLDQRIAVRDDTLFTNFLNANPDTFKYNYSEAESDIIQIFKNYKDSHSNANSVYMGRENGSFVRSHPRNSPSKYDPRTRPWYLAALASPEAVQLTEPYLAVTTKDINIGTVKALVDLNNQVFGVVGIDVTLEQVDALIDQFTLEFAGDLLLLTPSDSIIYNRKERDLLSSYETYLFNQGLTTTYVPLSSYKEQSPFPYRISMEKSTLDYRLIRQIERLPGRYVVHIPMVQVKEYADQLLKERFYLLGFSFLILLAATFIIIELQVLRPLRQMKAVIALSAEERIPMAMGIAASGEFLSFQKSYNHLVAQLQIKEVELKHVQLLAINTLTSLAEKRDHETGLHILRTQKYVELLSRAYVLRYQAGCIDESTIERWISCSPLHDIGKVAIPDSILMKPGPLTAAEFEEMKKHTLYGKETIERGNRGIEDQGFIQTAINLVYYHHERWDGTGYPDGLKADAIPLEARIMSVADVYDALTNHRVYKDAFSHEEAYKIIVEGRGTQFQPELVDLFMELQQSFKMIHEQHQDIQF